MGIPDWFPGGFREVEGEIQWYIVGKQARDRRTTTIVSYGRACIVFAENFKRGEKSLWRKKRKKREEGVDLVLKMSDVRKQTFEHKPIFQIDYSSFMKFLL